MAASGDKKSVLVTKDGLRKLLEELDHLKNARRKEVAVRLKEAISYGDLSENSEYEEAKNEQAFVEGRIAELEVMVKFAKIIDEKKQTGREDIVQLGSKVTIRSLSSGKVDSYTIVGSTEADALCNLLSNESPVGEALLGKKKGDHVSVKAPGGVHKYEIVGLG